MAKKKVFLVVFIYSATVLTATQTEHRSVQVSYLRSRDRAAPSPMLEEDKIIGGFDVDINDFPYHVAYGSNCAATLIHPKWAITAGHCGAMNFIKVGSNYFDKGLRYDVKTNYIHPNWEANAKAHPFDYDFQLLELRNRVVVGRSVKPIKIGKIEDMAVGVMLTVTGWGYINEDGPYSDVLRAVDVPIIPKETCQKVRFPYYNGQLTARMFCAGYSSGAKDACQGDSGGPAVANGKLLGIISFGYGCATPESYGVYSKVAKVRDWIEETTGLRFD